MSDSESLNLKVINLERELGAMKKQLKEIKKENEQLWKYIKSVERLASM